MKTLTSLLVLLTLSCSGNQKQKIVEKKQELEVLANKLVFDIDLETTKPDDFRLIANNVFLNNSQFMDISIIHKLNNNETSKKIHFEFPEGVQPDYQIGFSLGVKNVKEVKINNIVLSYGDLVYNITPSNFSKYFRLNRFLKYNEETGTLKTQKIENKLNPIFFLRKPFISKIQEVN